MKDIPEEIVKILSKWLPSGNEQKSYDFISEEGYDTKLIIHRHPDRGGYIVRFEQSIVIRSEQSIPTRTIYSFFTIAQHRFYSHISMTLRSYSCAEERLSKDDKHLHREWIRSTEVTPRMPDFDAHFLNLVNNYDPTYYRKTAFIEGQEELSKLAQSAESFLSKNRSR